MAGAEVGQTDRSDPKASNDGGCSLRIHFLNVQHGDSIIVEYGDDDAKAFGLVDSNCVGAVREALDPDTELMADANEAWRPDQALRALRALRPLDLVWVEEPITPDDLSGYAHVRAHGGVPLSAGENLHTLAEFAQLIGARGIDFPEPDLTTCGGITPWMKVAHLAEANALPVTSHGAHDIHVHLLAAVPNAAYLEVHGWGLDAYMADPLEMRDGLAIAPERPGHGITWNWDALSAHRV